MSNVDLYQSELTQPQKEIVKRLRGFIARHYPELTESLKWHVPIYSLHGKNLLGLQDFTAHVNLNFFWGAQLHDPRRILIGTGKRVRHVTFRSITDIAWAALKEFIDQAIAKSDHCTHATGDDQAAPRRQSIHHEITGGHLCCKTACFSSPRRGVVASVGRRLRLPCERA